MKFDDVPRFSIQLGDVVADNLYNFLITRVPDVNGVGQVHIPRVSQPQTGLLELHSAESACLRQPIVETSAPDGLGVLLDQVEVEAALLDEAVLAEVAGERFVRVGLPEVLARAHEGRLAVVAVHALEHRRLQRVRGDHASRDRLLRLKP